MAHGCWFVFKCWHTAEVLQAIILYCKHLDFNACFLSKSEQVEDLKPQGNWPRKIPCHGECAGDSNRASLWLCLSTGAVKADMLRSCANCGSLWIKSRSLSHSTISKLPSFRIWWSKLMSLFYLKIINPFRTYMHLNLICFSSLKKKFSLLIFLAVGLRSKNLECS